MYPYLFVAGPNKHNNLLDYLDQRNAKFDRKPMARDTSTDFDLDR
jgi:hypothetical protein